MITSTPKPVYIPPRGQTVDLNLHGVGAPTIPVLVGAIYVNDLNGDVWAGSSAGGWVINGSFGNFVRLTGDTMTGQLNVQSLVRGLDAAGLESWTIRNPAQASGNTFFGLSAGILTTGVTNTAIGSESLFSNITGTKNTVIGFQAGYGSVGTSFSDSTFVGYQSGFSITTGQYNTGVGRSSLRSITIGSQNTAIGVSSLTVNSTGSFNVAIGINALESNVSGSSNTAIGTGSQDSTTSSDNVSVGYQSLYSNVTGTRNTVIGTGAGYGVAANSFYDGTFVGYRAGYSITTGQYNTGVGGSALFSITSGAQNSALGVNALYSNTTGNNNTVMGFEAGLGVAANSFSNNSFLGYRTGYGLTTGSNNLLLGFQCGDNLTTGANNIIIGYDLNASAVGVSNELNIGGLIKGDTSALLAGNLGTVTTAATEWHVVSTSAADPRGIMSAQHSADAIGARIHFRKSRGTPTAPVVVTTGDMLGRIRFSGYDGSAYQQMGSIDVCSTGTIAANRVPTFMAFSTATDVNPSVLTERMRIFNTGNVSVGSSVITGELTEKFSVLGASNFIANGEQLNITMDAYYSAAAGNQWRVRKARGTMALPTACLDNDPLAFFSFRGHDGTSFVRSSAIGVEIDGVVGTNVMPGKIIFYTSKTATVLPRMAITCDGFIGVNTFVPKSFLDIVGNLTIGATYGGVTAAPTSGAIIEGRVGIGTDAPNANAILDVVSTTMAFMPPRMTTAQKAAIATPTAGMVVFDSTLVKLAVYNGATWETVASA
jgi:hypothetical protein